MCLCDPSVRTYIVEVGAKIHTNKLTICQHNCRKDQMNLLKKTFYNYFHTDANATTGTCYSKNRYYPIYA